MPGHDAYLLMILQVGFLTCLFYSIYCTVPVAEYMILFERVSFKSTSKMTWKANANKYEKCKYQE